MKVQQGMLPILLAMTCFVSGCATYLHNTNGFDASRVDKVIVVNQSTLADVRAIMGTPTITAVTRDSKQIIGYALVGNNGGANFMKNWGKGVLTLGFGSKTNDFTLKNVYFKFDEQSRVIEIRKVGYAYLSKRRVTSWNECEVKLTDAEINSPVHYSGDEICKRYAEDVAKVKGIPVKDVDLGEEFTWCNIPCHTRRGATELYGDLKELTGSVSALPGDGSRANELFGEDCLSTQQTK